MTMMKMPLGFFLLYRPQVAHAERGEASISKKKRRADQSASVDHLVMRLPTRAGAPNLLRDLSRPNLWRDLGSSLACSIGSTRQPQ